MVERFEENGALQHPIFKPVDLPEFQIGDDSPAPTGAFPAFRRSFWAFTDPRLGAARPDKAQVGLKPLPSTERLYLLVGGARSMDREALDAETFSMYQAFTYGRARVASASEKFLTFDSFC